MTISTFRHPFVAISTAVLAVVLAVVASAQLTAADSPADDGAVFVPIEPARIMDTRSDLAIPGPLSSKTAYDLQITGTIETLDGPLVIPHTATSVSLNVTVVRQNDAGFASIRPSGATGSPSTSNVNFSSTGATPNAVTATLGSDGAIQIWIEGSNDALVADVIVDVSGYYDSHDHDDRYYTKSSVDALAADVAESAATNATDIDALDTASSANATAIDALETASSANATDITDLNDAVDANAREILDLTTLPIGPWTEVVPIRHAITMTTESYVTENVQIVSGFDLTLVCTGQAGQQHDPHIGWDGRPNSTDVVVFPNGNGQIGQYDTQTTPLGTIFQSLPAAHDLTIVADISDNTTAMDVNVVVRVDGDTCTYDGSATASS